MVVLSAFVSLWRDQPWSGRVRMIVEPVTLEGKHVRLEPLSLAHHAALCEAGLDEDLWRWIAAPRPHAGGDARVYQDGAQRAGRGRRLAFRHYRARLGPGHRLDALRQY